MALTVERVDNAAQERAWEAYVEGATGATFFHRVAWRGILARVYGYEPHYLIARADGRVCGVLPLFLVRSTLFGRCLRSLPFQFLGGPVADDASAIEALLDAAREVWQQTGARALEFKASKDSEVGQQWRQRLTRTYRCYVVPLDGDPEAVRRRFKENVRRHIRKAEDALEVRELEASLWPEVFHQQYRVGMHALGIPCHAPQLFAELGERFVVGKDVRVTMAWRDGRAVGSLLTLQFGGRQLFWWGVRSPKASPAAPPMHALHWEAIAWGCRQGLKAYDFGLTAEEAIGAQAFKERWGSRVEEVGFYRLFGAKPARGDYHAGFGAAQQLWRRLPRSLAARLGPWVARQVG